LAERSQNLHDKDDSYDHLDSARTLSNRGKLLPQLQGQILSKQDTKVLADGVISINEESREGTAELPHTELMSS
jgi:hypothetical protein